jgi:hypothetical protein
VDSSYNASSELGRAHDDYPGRRDARGHG